MPIAATIGAVGAIGAAGISAYSASKASDQQVAAQQQALQAQNQNFNSALDFQKGAFGTAQNALNPFVTAGSNILPTLQSTITNGPDMTYANTLKGLLSPGGSASALAQMPGFQFQSQYGTMAATNALAARGLGGSAGPLARGISDYNNGLAGTQYFNTVNALQSGQQLSNQTQQQTVGQLQNFAGLGGNAAGALASAAGTAGANVGGLTANTNNTIGTTLTNQGNAAAAGTLGVGNALSGGLTGGANAYMNNALLSRLFPSSGGGIYASGGSAAP